MVAPLKDSPATPDATPIGPVAFDDPVPFGSETELIDRPLATPHRIERDLQRELRASDAAHFETLTVRRLPDGVCVQGTAEGPYDREAVAELVRKIAHVERVVDQVVSHR